MYTKQKNIGNYRSYDPTTGKMAIMSKPTEKSYDPTTGEMATMNKPTEISYDSTTGETAIVANKPKNRLAEYLIKRRKKEQEEKKRKEAEEKIWREAEARDAEQKKEAAERAKKESEERKAENPKNVLESMNLLGNIQKPTGNSDYDLLQKENNIMKYYGNNKNIEAFRKAIMDREKLNIWDNPEKKESIAPSVLNGGAMSKMNRQITPKSDLEVGKGSLASQSGFWTERNSSEYEYDGIFTDFSDVLGEKPKDSVWRAMDGINEKLKTTGKLDLADGKNSEELKLLQYLMGSEVTGVMDEKIFNRLEVLMLSNNRELDINNFSHEDMEIVKQYKQTAISDMYNLNPNIINDYGEALNDPIGGLVVKKASEEANNKAFAYYAKPQFGNKYIDENEEPIDADGTEQNAMKHALWNALATMKLGYDRAKKFTDAHESLTKKEVNVTRTDMGHTQSNKKHTEMDLFFNELGRQAYYAARESIAGENREPTIDELCDIIYSMIQEHKEYILYENPVEKKG